MTSMLPVAMYSCGARMRDATSRAPICADTLAARFADARIDQVLSFFRDFPRWHPGPLVRHRILDDLVRDRIAADPDTVVVSLRGGFDTRPFRVQGGLWIEIDEPVIVGFKEDRLPAAECPNELSRVPVDFGAEPLDEVLRSVPPDRPVLMVFEGLAGHLGERDVRAVVRAVGTSLPSATVLADFVSRAFFARHARPVYERFRALGAPFEPPPADPTLAWEMGGYRPEALVSVAERAIDLGVLRMTRFGLRSYSKTLHQGLFVAELRPRLAATPFADDPEVRAPGVI